MKIVILTFIAVLIAVSGARAQSFSALVGRGPEAADKWLGDPAFESEGRRMYKSAGYTINLIYKGEQLEKITILRFPEGKEPRTPAEVAALIEKSLTVGERIGGGILEHYSMVSVLTGVWEVALTPGKAGYRVVNITPPKGER